MAYYRDCESLVVVGYSFGALLIADSLMDFVLAPQDLPHNLHGAALIAAPINIKRRTTYDTSHRPALHQARAALYRLLAELTVGFAESMPLIENSMIARCAHDELLDDSVFDPSHEARQMIRRYVELDNVRHDNILADPRLRTHLTAYLKELA